MSIPKFPLLIALLIFCVSAFAQADTTGATGVGNAADTTGEAQDLYFIKKGQRPLEGKTDYTPNSHGFYIYRNAQYEFILADKKWITCRVLDIRRDSLYLLVFVNDSGRWTNRSMSPNEMRGIRLAARQFEIHSKFSLRDFRYEFAKTTRPRQFGQSTKTRYSADSSLVTYALIPFVTGYGVYTIYEERARQIDSAAQGRWVAKEAARRHYTPRIRRGVWFTPSGATEIRGVTIGLISGSLGEHPLLVRGLNLDADIATAFMAPVCLIYSTEGNSLKDLSDPVGEEDTLNLISGVSVSVGGLLANGDVHGLSINGGVCSADQVRGVLLSGLENINDKFRGVEIGGVLNRSAVGEGVQIGLFNVCKHLKGIQIGLWNVNSKRRLPFVNWGS